MPLINSGCWRSSTLITVAAVRISYSSLGVRIPEFHGIPEFLEFHGIPEFLEFLEFLEFVPEGTKIRTVPGYWRLWLMHGR